MARLCTPLIGGGTALLAVLLLGGPAQAQTSAGRRQLQTQRRGSVTKMEILNGPSRTVRYFGTNLSPGESSTLRELEALENESAYARDLQDLKKQYVLSEQILEPNRRYLQELLLQPENLVWPSYVAWPFTATAVGYPYAWAAGGRGAFFRSPLVNAGYPAAVSGPVPSYLGGIPDGRALADSYGYPDSPIKEALAVTMARQSGPEYVAQLERAAERVALRATTSPTLRVALGLPDTTSAQRERRDLRMAEGEPDRPAPITLTLKGGDVVRALKMREDGDWYVIETADESLRIRQSEVLRIARPRTGGIVPAAP